MQLGVTWRILQIIREIVKVLICSVNFHVFLYLINDCELYEDDDEITTIDDI